MAKKIILGVKAAKGKTGRVGYTYFYQEAFTDYESENCETVLGMRCGSEFSYKDFGCKPGDEMTFVYEKGFQDKAVLADMIPVKVKQ